MIFPNEILIKIAIVVLGVCGFLVAKHIRSHKTQNTPLVCMVGFDCHTVVHSDYAKFLGVPVEIFGMLYYAFIALTYLVSIFLPSIMPNMLVGFMIVISKLAFIFSLYLIGVQIFILKKGCSWCIVSAVICLCIFVLTTFNFDFTFITQIFAF
jgi:uncharacterized membrane protein